MRYSAHVATYTRNPSHPKISCLRRAAVSSRKPATPHSRTPSRLAMTNKNSLAERLALHLDAWATASDEAVAAASQYAEGADEGVFTDFERQTAIVCRDLAAGLRAAGVMDMRKLLGLRYQEVPAAGTGLAVDEVNLRHWVGAARVQGAMRTISALLDDEPYAQFISDVQAGFDACMIDAVMADRTE